MAGKLLPPKFSNKKEAQGAGKVIGTTESGQPIHMTHQPGLSGKDALDASQHHERKYQDHANQAKNWASKGYQGAANWHKGWAAHHMKQSKKYSEGLNKAKAPYVKPRKTADKNKHKPAIDTKMETVLKQKFM